MTLADFRNWLESELKLLGNASHHAYSFGQANMAKRALEQLGGLLAGNVALVLDRAGAAAAVAALERLGAEADPALVALRDRVAAALAAPAA